MKAPILAITERITQRSAASRARYLQKCAAMHHTGTSRNVLSCGNQAHAYAACGADKDALAIGTSGNIGIITAYNDMLSAHQPFRDFPELIKDAARKVGGTAQIAGGVPAMCDGVTQGQMGMELSLFSRDTIALAASVALSHQTYDSAVFLGVCDKIVPGLVIAAATFGHLPTVFLPAGPMTSGLSNTEKARVRQEFAAGKVGRAELMRAEMESYHGPGTCTFYGTANSNQMLMEFMGLHLPGASFVNPNTPLRNALTQYGAQQALRISALSDHYTPISTILDEKTYVNGMVGLMATGGSTNLLIHLIAMARASGVVLTWDDFADISCHVPLIAQVYPNGMADINHFHAAGGLGYIIGELLSAQLLHSDTQTVVGKGIAQYTQEPKLIENQLVWQEGTRESLDTNIVTNIATPFQKSGGLVALQGNLGRGVMKVSAVAEEFRTLTAKVRVFHDQQTVLDAFKAGEFIEDVIIVLRYQGPKANGMPELHSLTPSLSVLQKLGTRVALLTDGRMSGASGKVPSVIHISPEALENGPLAYLQDGDVVTMDAHQGILNAHDETIFNRTITHPDLAANQQGVGRELFQLFRNHTGNAETGASIFTNL